MAPLHRSRALSYANWTPQWHICEAANFGGVGFPAARPIAGVQSRAVHLRSGPDGWVADSRPTALSNRASGRGPPFEMFSSCSPLSHHRASLVCYHLTHRRRNEQEEMTKPNHHSVVCILSNLLSASRPENKDNLFPTCRSPIHQKGAQAGRALFPGSSFLRPVQW